VDVPAGGSGEGQFWLCAQSFDTAHARVQILNLQIASVRSKKNCVCISENLLTSDVHAAPLRFKFVGPHFAAQQLVTIREKFRKFVMRL